MVALSAQAASIAMSTVFSHIVQKHLSQSYENVSTDALAFVLSTVPNARAGLMRLLHSIAPHLPDLTFKTQLSEDTSRPDMWGMDKDKAHVFLENKFWAGLTGNQPVKYLKILSESDPEGVLLFIAPREREDSLWRELMRRLDAEGVGVEPLEKAAGVARAAKTQIGPVIALTSWDSLLSLIELAIAGDPEGIANIVQLRSLCAAADGEAFTPLRPEETSDQRIPALILEIGRVVQDACALAAEEGSIRIDGLRPSASWDSIGRYVKFACAGGYEGGFGAFFGVDFKAWKSHGITPLWLCFATESADYDWRRGEDARAAIQNEAWQHKIFTAMESKEFVVAISIPTGEELESVKRAVASQLRFVAGLLARVPAP